MRTQRTRPSASHRPHETPLQNSQQFGKTPARAPKSLQRQFGTKCDRNSVGNSELRATVNPRNNLAHCFSCGTNFNNIDLLMTQGYDFLPAVSILENWLEQYRQDLGQAKRHA